MLRAFLLVTALLGGCLFRRMAQVVINGEQIDLRTRPAGARPNAPETQPLLVLALDGVSRDLLYDMLRGGKLPKLATLLGGDRFEHAYFDDTLLSTLPS